MTFGLRFVLYNYITNEFGIGDGQAGALLGIKGFVDIAFGLLGSILVDIYGVRKLSMISLSVALVGRTLISFGRTKGALYLALYFFSPCGDALLSVGLYKVALKKLTTPLTRPLGFALSYSAFNLAGGLADVLIDVFRGHLGDANVETNFMGLGGVYTPVRQFVVLTWMILVLTWVIAFYYLEDMTVVDIHDVEDDGIMIQLRDTRETTRGGSEGGGYLYGDANNNNSDLAHEEPMVRPRLLRYWFPKQYQSLHMDEIITNDQVATGWVTTTTRRLPSYKVYKTQYKRVNTGESTSVRVSMITFANQVIAILRMRATWRVIVFGFATSAIAMNWTASELILPPFLERRFGEATPIYVIQSINLFGCLILPPLVGAYTSGREDFTVFMPGTSTKGILLELDNYPLIFTSFQYSDIPQRTMPPKGLWIMAISPMFIAISPNVIGACAWQVVMTAGEVLWSPRQGSWVSSLAPTGSEGLFFAVSSARSVFGPLTDFLMGALNDRYNPNCLDCRDSYGHFCHKLSSDESLQCASVQESCNVFLEYNQQSCPATCLQCPSWEPIDPSTCWYLLLVFSFVSPLCIWYFLPFLRGNRSRDNKFYGLFSCNKNRFSGVYGALEDKDEEPHRFKDSQVYGHVCNFHNDAGYKRKISLGDDVELT
ncbi:hypothetical protein ACHAXA_008933 [Cyclostephanos tholiformis]|uniref:Uncharacterized protein n=1 Tax=Cyclostephanos tholiformis TaxID=382380 RepID=A0ABD3RSQ0_9STRA